MDLEITFIAGICSDQNKFLLHEILIHTRIQFFLKTFSFQFSYCIFFKGDLTEIFWCSVVNDLTCLFLVTLMKLNENISSPIAYVSHTKLSIGIYYVAYFDIKSLHGKKEVLAFLSALLNHKTTIKLQKVNEVQTCLSGSKVGKNVNCCYLKMSLAHPFNYV